jgi:dihydrofolate synthase/folylpolyglutamate synthase
VGGRLLSIRTPEAVYDDVLLPLHGAFQGDNAAVAVTAAEAFFGRALDPETVAAGLAEVTVPGRLEVAGRAPLVVLDGAHNPAGAEAAQAVLRDDFGVDPDERVLVLGLLRGREPEAVLEALDAPSARAVVTCTPDSPRAVPAAELAGAARRLGATDVVASPSVDDALDTALALAGDDHAVLVTGSLYVVGAARRRLGLA